MLELIGHQSAATAVAYSPNGLYIVTGGSDGTAKVWDARMGTPWVEIKNSGSYGVALGPDGKRLVTGNNDGRFRLGPMGNLRSVSSWIWDTTTGARSLELTGLKGFVQCVAFSRDGTRVAIGGWVDESPVRFPRKGREWARGRAVVWNARTGERLRELVGLRSGVYTLAFSPDGKRLVTGGASDALTGRGWDAREKPLEVKLWDLETGALLLDLTRPASKPTGVNARSNGLSVAFRPDGAQIVVAGDYREGEHILRTAFPRVHDARTGAVLFELPGRADSPVRCVAYSPDGSTIVAGEGSTARVWDVGSDPPSELVELKGHAGDVNGVAFSPDGQRIVTGSRDGTVRVWDVRTGTPLVTLDARSQGVGMVAFSSDGTRVVAHAGRRKDDHFNRLIVWDVPPTSTTTDAGEPSAEELAYRQLRTEPKVERHLEGYLAAKALKNDFAMAFHRDRIPAAERDALLTRAEMDVLGARRFASDDEKEVVLNELLSLKRTQLGDGHPETLLLMYELAELRTAMGGRDPASQAKAVELYIELTNLFEQWRGLAAPETLQVVDQLAGLHRRTGDFEKADARYEQLVEGRTALHGPTDHFTLSAMHTRAGILLDAGRPRDAIPLLREVWRLTKGTSEEVNLAFESANDLVTAYRKLKMLDEAETLLLDCRAELTKLPNTRETSLYKWYWNGAIPGMLGRTHLEQERWAEAEASLREYLKFVEEDLEEPDSYERFRVVSEIGESLMGQKKHAEAETLLLEGYEGMKKREKTNSSQNEDGIPPALDRLVEFYTRTSKPDEAEKWRKERDAHVPWQATAADSKPMPDSTDTSPNANGESPPAE